MRPPLLSEIEWTFSLAIGFITLIFCKASTNSTKSKSAVLGSRLVNFETVFAGALIPYPLCLTKM